MPDAYDFSTPTVKIVDALHPDGFVIIDKADFEERKRLRAKALQNGEPVDYLPEMVIWTPKKTAA